MSHAPYLSLQPTIVDRRLKSSTVVPHLQPSKSQSLISPHSRRLTSPPHVIDSCCRLTPPPLAATSGMELLMKGASEYGAKRIKVHILTDGHDVIDGTSVGFVETLESDIEKLR